ncbi:hypothetical protein [Kitasatospora sp. NPDC086791]|uniref:hypothetical protein n=1 Tax=Kitasatospora sp. NPDC086791 TaxID=3155178 RepID=UPI003441FED6
MGAALHLAHAHQLPPGPKRKRKNSDGGGSEFDRYATRIYRDDRADHEAKELLLALAYVLTHPREDDEKPFTAASKLLGHNRIGGWRIRKLIANDVPRYESPIHRPFSQQDDELFKRCAAPRLRPFKEPAPVVQQSLLSLTFEGPGQPSEHQEDFRNRLKVCGAEASDYVIEKLPETGWHKPHWFCTRHRAEQNRTQRQLVEPNKLAPKPIPNAGGLMPCYFDSDWEYVYRFYMGERWEPPVYGLRADDWPVPGREPVPQRARLRLAAVDGELLGGVM